MPDEKKSEKTKEEVQAHLDEIQAKPPVHLYESDEQKTNDKTRKKDDE